jgi:cytochrome b involved in lipid metabolism
MSRFLEDHPGGAKAILLYAGREATEEFEMVHPANTLEKHAKHIGESHFFSLAFKAVY